MKNKKLSDLIPLIHTALADCNVFHHVYLFFSTLQTIDRCKIKGEVPRGDLELNCAAGDLEGRYLE